MEKNTILAIVLSSIVLMASMFIQYKFFPQQPTTATEQTTATSVDSENQAIPVVDEETVPSFLAETVVSAESSEAEEPENQYTIKTNVAEIVFTNHGGDIVSYKLLDHEDGEDFVQMVDNLSETNRAFGIALGGATSPELDEVFTTKIIDDYTIGFYKKLAVKNADGTEGVFTLAKQYTFQPDEYVFKLDIIINGEDGFYGLNYNNAAYTLRTPPQIGPYYNQKNNKYETRTFMSYTDGKKKKQMLSPGQSKEYDKSYTWTGVAGKYFTILAAPANQSFNKAFYSMEYGAKANYSNAQVFLTRDPVSAQKMQDSFYVYVGPRTEASLKHYNNAVDNSWDISGLRFNDSMESSNLLGWLEIILKWIMELFYKLIPNWGISIILMTILLKVALFPLTKKSSVSTLKMQELQPRMQELQTKYKGQPEKLNTEMAKLYKETGYNPLSGCLPLLIQFPLIFAMYNLFNNYFEFRGAMFIPGWIPDLSIGDKVYTFGFDIPFLGNELHILPIIYVFSQVLFSKITQAATPATQENNSMKIMMYVMPFMFFFIFYNAPSGLILYWTLSNLLQLVQQISINKVMKTKKEEMALAGTKKSVISAKKRK